MTRPVRILSITLLFVVIVGLGYLALRVSKSPPPNVLWITMDSLRGDHLGCAGHARAITPNIDGLAAEGALFAHCVSQASYTRISVPSMITAKYPFFLGVRKLHGDLDSAHVTLAELLAAEGYFTYTIAENWPSGFFQGMERVNSKDRRTPQKTQMCLEALDQLDGRPFFIWLYYWDPHAPYEPPEVFLREPQAEQIGPHKGQDVSRVASGLGGGAILLLLQLNRGKVTLTQAESDYLLGLYDAEISFVDSEIGKVVSKLKDLGHWDNTVVVLSADHGEAFGEHGLYYHGHTLYDEEVRVPLIIKPPHPSPITKAIEGPVRNVDILPTILDYCAIRGPQNLDGTSLRPYMEQGLRPHLATCIETHSARTKSHLMAYRDAQHKLIYDLTHGETQLYDLTADPEERDNLLAQAEVAQEDLDQARQVEGRLREKLLQILGVKTLSDLQPEETPDSIDAETLQQLKALGYIY